jgi:hypothetical protein
MIRRTAISGEVLVLRMLRIISERTAGEIDDMTADYYTCCQVTFRARYSSALARVGI